MTGCSKDHENNWAVEFQCGHVRHDTPWQLSPWVTIPKWTPGTSRSFAELQKIYPMPGSKISKN